MSSGRKNWLYETVENPRNEKSWIVFDRETSSFAEMY
jgi:hypothetical protein